MIRLSSIQTRWHSVLWITVIIALLVGGYVIGSTVMASSDNGPSHVQEQAQTQVTGGTARVDPPYQLQDFTLTSQTGEPVSLSDFRGKAVLFFFGYTHCPDVCPTTLADYTRIKQALGEAASDVAFVFISIDGERDTPDVVAEYLQHFDADFVGMTGDAAALQAVGQEYGLVVQRVSGEGGSEQHTGDAHAEDVPADNYFVEHTSPSFLVDPDGFLRTVFFYQTAPSAIADGIRLVLQ